MIYCLKKRYLNLLLRAILLLSVFILSGCSRPNGVALSALASQGKATYMSNCIACHNPDPRLVGSIGPDVAGSSLELLTARILHKSYPLGYKPKRTSGLMPELPFLEKDIPALHAYLNSFIQK